MMQGERLALGEAVLDVEVVVEVVVEDGPWGMAETARAGARMARMTEARIMMGGGRSLRWREGSKRWRNYPSFPPLL